MANIIIPEEGGDIGFKKNEDGTIEPFLPNKAVSLALKIISKRGGGTGELEYFYTRRAILKTISEQYGHFLKNFSVNEASLVFSIHCK